MNAEVFLTPGTLRREDVRGRTVVVIDVLRACTTIVVALGNGARGVIPVADMAEAGKIASNLDPAAYLLGGERDAVPIDGYHLGNSPASYDAATVRGRTIILNTTNGTGAFVAASGAARVLAGAFVNAQAVVEALCAGDADVTFVCAGWKGRASLEDTLCAGLMLHRLFSGRLPADATDSVRIAMRQYQAESTALDAAVRESTHARRLVALGFDADVALAAQVDTCPLVPVLRDSCLVPLKRAKAS